MPFLEQLIAVGGILITLILAMAALLKLAFGLIERLLGKIEKIFDKRMEAGEALLVEQEKRIRLENTVLELEKKQFSQEQKIDVLEKDAHSRGEVLIQWEARMELLEQERGALQKKVEELEKRLELSEKEKHDLRDEFEKRIDALENQIDQLTTERDDLLQERNDLKERVGVLEKVNKPVDHVGALTGAGVRMELEKNATAGINSVGVGGGGDGSNPISVGDETTQSPTVQEG